MFKKILIANRGVRALARAKPNCIAGAVRQGD
jgi:hypothetical protein